MKERPIIFSAPMVRAILDGRKTQTRRAITTGVQPCDEDTKSGLIEFEIIRDCPIKGTRYWRTSPCGRPGDRLWVRENWRYAFDADDLWDCIEYQADGRKIKPDLPDGPDAAKFEWWCNKAEEGHPIKFRPSIHMPRWASRITLEITDTCVERLTDISTEAAKREGAFALSKIGDDPNSDLWTMTGEGFRFSTPSVAFLRYWDSINEKRGFGWDKNPWVWVICFKRVEAVHA